jgi:hypothetical protein
VNLLVARVLPLIGTTCFAIVPDPPLALNVTVYEEAATAGLDKIGADSADAVIRVAVNNPSTFAFIY